MNEKELFEKAMADEGFEPPVRGTHGGYLYAEDAKAWGAWQLARNTERETCAKTIVDLYDSSSTRNIEDFVAAIRERSNVEVQAAGGALSARSPGTTG